MDERFPRWMSWVASKKWGRNFSKWVFTPLDKAVYKITGGKRGLSPAEAVLYLTTTGRRSGQPRKVPVLFLRDGERFWVMASNYGQEHHPAWSYNLLADANATVQVGRETVQVTARLGSDEEKERLWPRLVKLYPAWNSYASWTERDFRLFCLEPRE